MYDSCDTRAWQPLTAHSRRNPQTAMPRSRNVVYSRGSAPSRLLNTTTNTTVMSSGVMRDQPEPMRDRR